MTEDNAHPLVKRDGNDVLVVPPITASLVPRWRRGTDDDGYIRLSWAEAGRLNGDLEALGADTALHDQRLADELREVLGGEPPSEAGFSWPSPAYSRERRFWRWALVPRRDRGISTDDLSLVRLTQSTVRNITGAKTMEIRQ
jgi:hypothetical protein